jgi:cyanophycinase-like exopeptidase
MTIASIFTYMRLKEWYVTVVFMMTFPALVCAQTYTSYVIGDSADVITSPLAGTVLMGGATENDNAVRWFLERADGGDVVVLRTTGDDGYNDYFFSGLGISINSVETIVCHDAGSGSDPYVIQQVANAEALWFAGGDQWDYISYWRDTPLEDAFNELINTKKITIGGTSAGCAIQGDAYFSAENGTITSTQALHDPFHNLMRLGYGDFLENPATTHMITDTHYDNPDRRGRHMAFLARLFEDTGIPYVGIGVEEYTAVCIDENNIAHVYGSYPDFADYAYFLQVNCVLPNTPETCVDGSNLTWDRDHAAVKVIKIAGLEDGSGTVDLNDWKTVSGGDFTWDDWWVDNAIFSVTEAASPIECDTSIAVQNADRNIVSIYPNPTDDWFVIKGSIPDMANISIVNMVGEMVMESIVQHDQLLHIEQLNPGMYVLCMMQDEVNYRIPFVKK